MKKILLVFVLLMTSMSLMAQKYTQVTGTTTLSLAGSPIELKTVIDGTTITNTSTLISSNGSFGFLIEQGREGFVAITHKKVELIFYVKPGDNLNLDIDFETEKYTLKGKNTEENRVISEWYNLIYDIILEQKYTKESDCSSVRFFDLYAKKNIEAQKFISKIKTKNPKFDELMKYNCETDMIYFATSFRYKIDKNHPKKSDFPKFYNEFDFVEMLKTDKLLSLPQGIIKTHFMGLFYTWYNNIAYDKTFDTTLSLLDNELLKGEYIITVSSIRNYDDYTNFVTKYGKYITTTSQKKRLETMCVKASSLKKGTKATDFTYSDINGKAHSLSDFKGKVVYVDVWATWCGPCKAQFPHLEKLQEELKDYDDINFIGISVDKQEDIDAWKKMVVDKKLGGTQLFAGGMDSRIVKIYGVKTIPRFLIFDKKGNIYSTDAIRPSDPKLKELLIELSNN